MCSHGAAGRNRPLNIRELLNVEIPIIDDKSDLVKINEAANLVISYRQIDKEQTELLDEYKISLISAVVTGQIDVRGIDVPEIEYMEETEDMVDDDAKEDDITEEEEV